MSRTVPYTPLRWRRRARGTNHPLTFLRASHGVSNMMTLQLNASLPAAAPSTSAGSSQRGPDAFAHPADRNIRMGTVLRPTTYIRGRHPIIQPLNSEYAFLACARGRMSGRLLNAAFSLAAPREWKAFGVIDERWATVGATHPRLHMYIFLMLILFLCVWLFCKYEHLHFSVEILRA